MVNKLDDYIINIDKNVMSALKKINRDENYARILFACDDENNFYGTITDGDIRRFLIEDGDMETSVTKVMYRQPYVIYTHQDRNINYKEVMQERQISAIPILDNEGKLVDFVTVFDEKEIRKTINLPVVIMAGGKGTRLKPYTNILPKPLIPIGDKTITERIIDEFIKNGCNDFYLIVNYKKDFIKSYFSEALPEFKINYIDETEFYGTGGGLTLCKGMFKDTFIMTNCDIIIDDIYYKYIEEHKKRKNMVTVIAANMKMKMSYGIIKTDENGEMQEMKEKPEFSFLTNTGFYIIEPGFLDMIPEKQFIHMPDLLMKCKEEGHRVGVYSIDEQNWMDMGQFDALEKMRERYE